MSVAAAARTKRARPEIVATDSPPADPASADPGRIAAVRHFNRFYTKKIGVLNEHLLETPFSLAEARVIRELALRARATATELRHALDLDAGYMSRMLRGFEKKGLVAKERSAADGRASLLSLTARGRKAFRHLDARSSADVAHLIEPLGESGRDRLVAAMGEIESLLGPDPDPKAPEIELRAHKPGDMGWIMERHGAYYAEHHGWGPGLEANVADTLSSFLHHFNPACERCWIAELDGERVGSVMLVKRSDEEGQLRLLMVEDKARGHGLGTRLVEECLRFARSVGYRKVILWTHSNLEPARRIYARAGFRITQRERHRDFGPEVESEYWEVEL
ncbi:MAG TPA: helix-turn-helix domain-containing GNAT family N-acetyltransferase [Alphaproteobacteria bacterium]|nr:helix-turn-helix domain-containing GNAT family N-acetyltransferase [Alphaproteobacteria bacterium]